jgi:hypothetical protein
MADETKKDVPAEEVPVQDSASQEAAAQDGEVSFVDDGGRPRIDRYAKASRFRPNDDVYLIASGQREGPFKIAQVNGGKYILSDARGRIYAPGRQWTDRDLELINYF